MYFLKKNYLNNLLIGINYLIRRNKKFGREVKNIWKLKMLERWTKINWYKTDCITVYLRIKFFEKLFLRQLKIISLIKSLSYFFFLSYFFKFLNF